MEDKKKQTASNQPRDGNTEKTFGQTGQRERSKGRTDKTDTSHRKKRQYRESADENAFGQSEQKKDTKQESRQEQMDYSEEGTFSEGNGGSDDYHRRDTYHQSQKKSKYRRREYQDRERTKKTDFERDFATKDVTFTEKGSTESGGSRKSDRLQKKAEKAADKTAKARKKLPKKTEYSFERVFNEETGKAEYKLVAVKKDKPFKPDNPVKMMTGRAKAESMNFVHGKISEVEKENSGVEGAHKTEQKAEDVYHFVKKAHRSKAQRQRAKVAKLEKKQFQKEVNFRYQKFLEENPEMQEKTLKKL